MKYDAQVSGLDYEDTFAPILQYDTKDFYSLQQTQPNRKLHQLDVKIDILKWTVAEGDLCWTTKMLSSFRNEG